MWREIRASYAFVERNFYLVRRYWGWEIAFLIYNITSSLSVMYHRQGAGRPTTQQSDPLPGDRHGGLGVSARRLLNISEMIAWERWEGTIEYTMMAPISRLTHMLGVSLFSIVYGLVRTALLLVALASSSTSICRTRTPVARWRSSLVGSSQLRRLRHHGGGAAAALHRSAASR